MYIIYMVMINKLKQKFQKPKTVGREDKEKGTPPVPLFGLF